MPCRRLKQARRPTGVLAAEDAPELTSRVLSFLFLHWLRKIISRVFSCSASPSNLPCFRDCGDDSDTEEPAKHPWWSAWHQPGPPAKPPTLRFLSGVQVPVELSGAVRVHDVKSRICLHLGMPVEQIKILHSSGCAISDHLPLLALETADLTVVLNYTKPTANGGDDWSISRKPSMSRCPRVQNMKALARQWPKNS